MCVANGLRCTDTCRLADCESQASVSDSEESSDEEVKDVDYENYYDYWVMNVCYKQTGQSSFRLYVIVFTWVTLTTKCGL